MDNACPSLICRHAFGASLLRSRGSLDGRLYILELEPTVSLNENKKNHLFRVLGFSVHFHLKPIRGSAEFSQGHQTHSKQPWSPNAILA